LDLNACGATAKLISGFTKVSGPIACGTYSSSSPYEPSTLQESLLTVGARLGLRVPLRYVAVEIGSGLHILDWTVTSVTYTNYLQPGSIETMSSRPTGGSSVHASVPLWVAFEFKPWCDWVGNLSAGAELPTADDGNGTFQPSFVGSIQFGYQPSFTCRANQ
jgi:hypothetical protein